VHDRSSVLSFVTLSYGPLPLSFLRGCGLPDALIAYYLSLDGKVIRFYSCFLSYSTKDQPFAERIYADLQGMGIRCWFAPANLKIGDPFRQRIEESIRIHDKLLLILSEHSVDSPWVQDEVEAALERERREGRLVLFPALSENS
jgi:TIR domain